jgi:hypothetical protein
LRVTAAAACSIRSIAGKVRAETGTMLLSAEQTALGHFQSRESNHDDRGVRNYRELL